MSQNNNAAANAAAEKESGEDRKMPAVASVPTAQDAAQPSSTVQQSLSLSQHLFTNMGALIDTKLSPKEKRKRAAALMPLLASTADAYWTLHNSESNTNTGVPPCCILPALDWSSSFRKAYTLLLWIRPRLEDIVTSDTSDTGNNPAKSPKNSNGQEYFRFKQPQVFYRFATGSDDSDSRAVGVSVTCGDWNLIQNEVEESSKGESSDTDGGGKRRKISTLLTACSLPLTTKNSHASSSAPKGGTGTSGSGSGSGSTTAYSSAVQVPLTLELDTWQLVGFSHVFPYLKRPRWTVTVNGQTVGHGELVYPIPTESSGNGNNNNSGNSNSGASMKDCTVLKNMASTFLAPAAPVPVAPVSVPMPMQVEDSTDSTTVVVGEEDVQEQQKQQQELVWDVASIALYPEDCSPTVLAVAAEAGPNLSLQQAGRIISILPPVANWSKGSSMDGPKVGIPLVVHSAALNLQRLSSRVVFCCTALGYAEGGGVEELGTTDDGHRRIVFRMQLQPGATEGTPRVGLIQPATAIRVAMQDLPVLVVTGQCSVHVAVEDYVEKYNSNSNKLNKNRNTNTNRMIQNLDGTTLNLSVAVAEQPILSFLVLPFFLSLCPPGKIFETQQELYEDSIEQLWALYSGHGAYAAQLVSLLAAYITAGGARVAEDVLQSGILHILASCLRQSLLRAAKVKFFREPVQDVQDLKRRFEQVVAEDSFYREGMSPSHIPHAIVDACAELISACCGPAATSIDELSPAMQIRRTSDMALTSVFGLALDFDLWGGDARAASVIYKVVADRYGGVDLTAGYILRSQLSVQYLLDTVRLRYDSQVASPALEQAAQHLSHILQAMLFSSLSNRRSISQGEHDVSACIGALSDCPLGSVGSHLILNAIVGILAWCDVLPVEVASSFGEPTMDENHKIQVATRLGRNLLMAQFHDVVAPVVLSRTVFSGERTLVQPKPLRGAGSYEGSLSWPSHWRLSLLLFSWVASIAGPEGMIAAKSSGSLLLASGLAGSLKGALDDADKVLITSLFLPPPGMALMIGSTVRNEWSYTDLLSDRLQIMVPILPGMVVSLLSHPSDSTSETKFSVKSMVALSEVLTAVGAAFHRVFGAVIHSSGGSRRQVKNRHDGYSESIKAAKTFVPHLIVVAMLLENHITLRSKPEEGTPVQILHTYAPSDPRRQADSDSWVNVSSTMNESLIDEVVVALPSGELETDPEALLVMLRSCQKSVMNTASGLITNAMSLGGSGASISLWQSILSTFGESFVYASREETDSPEARDNVKEHSKSQDSKAALLAENVLCRLIALVLTKALKQNKQSEAWSYEMSSAVSKLCFLVDEKGLLDTPKGVSTSSRGELFSSDQVILLCAVLGVLAYGREATGWCQLLLPTTSNAMQNDRKKGPSSGDLAAASKLLLPILHPCLRVAIGCADKISSSVRISSPAASPSASSDAGGLDAVDKEEFMVDRLLSELKVTLTAAVVGLSFSNARDVALNAMATLRRAMRCHSTVGDERAAKQCSSLLCDIAEELRVRYEGERRLRETALFDAYEDDAQDSVKQAAEESRAVERLILGGDVFDFTNDKQHERSEEISFESNEKESKDVQGVGGVSDDFVLFHEPSGASDTHSSDRNLKLGYAQYVGLGAALEESKIDNTSTGLKSATTEAVLSNLRTYLDNVDATVERDAEESELVQLFDTAITTIGAPQQFLVVGSETAADAMSTFFEFAAAEKSRLKEISIRFLPSHRYSRTSYAQRFCWARHMEVASTSISESAWERGVPDGNRDIRTRLPTLPCAPQFRRYIPKYLDHAPTTPGDMEETDETAGPEHRASAAPGEIDAFTKSLLNSANLEIVDVTKKDIVEEDEPDLIRRSSMDDDDDDEYSEFIGRERMDSNDEDVKPGIEVKVGSEQPIEDTSLVDDTPQGEEPSNVDITMKGSHSITSSTFATPPDNASSSLSLMQSAAAGMIELSLDNCLHVRAEGSRSCTMLLSSTTLILEYDGEPEGFFEGELMTFQEEADRQRMAEEVGGPKDQDPELLLQRSLERKHREVAALRAKSIRWNLSEVSHIYLRRYRLRDSSLEIFFIPSGGTAFGGYGLFSPTTSIFVDFGPGYEGNTRRDDAAVALMKRAPPQAVKQWPDRSGQFLHDQLSRLTMGWVEGRVTNFDYLLHLNMLSGRSYNDMCQYPVFPWVLADYTSEEIPDLTDKKSFRDLTKPVGALNPQRLEELIERFSSFADPYMPPFMYGSHYSTSAGVVLHFLVRLHPFAGLHRQLQGGNFDVADRLFSSVPRTFSMVTGTSAAEVKELTPEWYCNPTFLKNSNSFKLGTSQDGEVLGDVELPPWAKGSPEKFVEIMRAALESERCSEMLPDWVDLIFGRKQQGPESIKANNVFFYLTYYGSVDVASIEDESLRKATELQIAHFGQCPMQLFKRHHLRRLPRGYQKLSFFQVISSYSQKHARETTVQTTEKDESDETPRPTEPLVVSPEGNKRAFGEPFFLPFISAPLSHWVHLDAPPPGPHAPLIAVRLAGIDRCLSVDAKGIFHSFRWAWRAEEALNRSESERNFDSGCFIAQRELPRFRSVPRLMHTPPPGKIPPVAISKTLFAGRSVLLVLSDGDGRGALALQLVDPAKGAIRGEVLIPSVHAACITCISTDPIGTAAGHGGVGGELALIGSADGNASLWRFMSSHYLPLRPRVRLQGHNGAKICAVALCSTIHIAATVSSDKCCLHSIGNGTLIRSFGPPSDTLDLSSSVDFKVTTEFADTPALALSVQGFVVTVCQSTIRSSSGPARTVMSLHLFTMEGVSLGSKPLESWRGLPRKISCTPDGTAVLVCCGRGVTIHRVSACQPLEFIDEWQITESDDLTQSTPAAFDFDLGPSLSRPVVAAAACSSGVLRLHALPGISAWSERHKKSGLGQTVGSALAKPAQRLKSAMRDGLGFGRQLASAGREIGREVTSDVKERGVGGFLGSVMFRKNTGDNNK